METKFTPAPWVVTNVTDIFTELGASTADGVECDANDGWHIADCAMAYSYVNGEMVDMGFDERKANARLIAAAPELYELLLLVLDDDHACGNMTTDTLTKINAVLSKAGGEQP